MEETENMYLQSEEFQLCELRFVGTVDTHMQIQTHMPHIDNNTVQTLGCLASQWACASLTTFFFSCLSQNEGHFFAALPH